jgi:hypothetical protein
VAATIREKREANASMTEFYGDQSRMLSFSL